ncbi:Peptidoglycan transglycosylase [Pseudooceanicola batsensis HTCC2597]|uniref:Biosynthetic peptidoglycan transglycosylase n=1 Tax=Pseudooceanicola batsensis (strain ATCC BAA-863 / DSM 15984 / KCTC 12145 / HTCC2597) TaxID=252305 RepID=A3TWF9_PSEBH|nr:monofunctional biosynthetic peptidoglycan transglycosylase [Pseudooceanicola batsensis]EAQ03955.1 Peptidoglycan transglycosylase [Pseudooceanicola batsensis HTCC2597]
MARQAGKRSKTAGRSRTSRKDRRFRPLRWLRRWTLRALTFVAVAVLAVVALYAVVNPVTGIYMKTEEMRLGSIDHQWVGFDEIAPVMARSAVAAEDANFCTHWGFDMAAIRNAIDAGGNRGASTITQQVIKNVFLWHGRSWLRKALEAAMTPVVELVWSKRRILEVYLNMAEFDEGVFGVDAAAHHYFGIGPGELNATQAARLAAVLPSPKQRSASKPTDFVRKRAASVMDGAATIRRDGRAACFED